MITHSKVVLEEDDLAGVQAVLGSGQLAQGKITSSLEKKIASFVGVDYAVAVSSGTAALHLALLSLEIGHGDEVIIPSYVCTALVNAIHYVRAKPVLVDIDPSTYNIKFETIEEFVTKNTKAIIVPHMFGLPADIDNIVSMGIPIIEDCAHSVGAKFRDKPVGSFGRLSIFSLYATKMLCAGEGGLVASDDLDLIDRIRDLRGYDEKENYTVRFNYKLSNIHAALGESQFNKLPMSIQRRCEIAKVYDTGLEGVVSSIPKAPQWKRHVYYRYVIAVEDPMRFIEGMREKGIQCRRPVFKPLHRYLGLPGHAATEDAWSKAVSIPIYPSLTEGEANRIVKAVRATI